MYQNIFYDRRLNTMHIWDDKFGHQTFRYKKYAYTKKGKAAAKKAKEKMKKKKKKK